MTVVLYDDLSINESILLDLPFREGTGTITQDVAKPHHPIDLINTPTWTALGSGLMTLNLNGINEYLECDTADTGDLDFTSGDYSVGGWFNWADTVHDSQIIIARYEVSDSGWEVYLTESGALRYLTLRHHHLAGASLRTGAYSLGWAYGTNWFFGISRSGTSAQFYRNGAAVTTTSDTLIDPETCSQDLVIGTRYTKDSNYISNMLWRPRVWGRALTADDWMNIYQLEKGWF